MTSGLLVVDKPGGMTSHDVVAGVRRALGTKSVGHAGTLDPMATGVLLVLVGEATKLAGYLALETKSYLAEVCFGRATDTLDAEGTVLAERPLPDGGLDRARVEAALDAERRRTEQIPPVVSAIKVDGQRSYRLARRGAAPELAARPVHVASLELASLGAERIEVTVTASKGYYVRALARDLGERLDLPAHLSCLRRTRSGAFELAEATALPLTAPWPLLPLTTVARRCLPTAELSEEGAQRARQGKPLLPEHFVVGHVPPDEPSAWILPPDALVAVGARQGDAFRVLRGFR